MPPDPLIPGAKATDMYDFKGHPNGDPDKGWTMPKLKRDPFRSRRTTLVALAALVFLRLLLPAERPPASGPGTVTR